MSLQRVCPCGGMPEPGAGVGASYDVCCGRLHRGSALAQTPEELMRSRYAAFVVGGQVGADHLFRTWHPRTRPAEVSAETGRTWTGLRILDAVGDQVEFVASYVVDGVAGDQRERSHFEQRAGRWVYVDAV